jgi:predicted ATPase/class 3 adenylate cyclase
MAAVAQPAGTVSLVFTDIEGSTRLLEQLGVDGYRQALREHRRIVREACARYQGYEVDYEGDAFFYAFATATDAVAAVSEFMVGLESGPIRVRVGVHTGEPALDPPKYVGLDVHRAARIMSSAHGGQVVLSRETAQLLPDGVFVLRDLGDHRFKDLGPPERVHQLLVDGLPHEFPRLKSLYRVTLPVPSTPFLGREQELAEVVARLTDPDTRLLTLTGPGGTGKTRLALQAAAEAADQFPDGVFWVPLAPLRDPALLVPTLAQALEVREEPGEALAATVASRLLGKRALVVVDNAEHLLPDLAHDLAALTAACPTLQLIVTSRERLQIGVERELPVESLGPDDALALLVARAEAVGVALAADAVAVELVERLDRLPLAIELAASRLKLFGPLQLLERLGERLDLLKGARDLDPRQQTLRATIDWSYQLLDADEQRVYRALSVFAGGCTYDAAEQVCGADADLLQSLLDKSLVRRRDTDQAPRYWMLETIREHAAERLAEAGEERSTRDGHLRWAASAVETLAPRFVRIADERLLQRLLADEANVFQALAWATETERTEAALQIVARMGRAWFEGGLASKAIAPANRALALPGGDPGTRGAAVLATAVVAALADGAGALRQLESAEQALRITDQNADAAFALMFRGHLLAESGIDLEAGIGLVAAAVADYESLGNENGVRIARGNLAAVLVMRRPLAQDDLDRLIELNLELVEEDRRDGDAYDLLIGLGNLAEALALSGRHDEAEAAALESLTTMRQVGARRDVDRTVIPTLIQAAAATGRHERALVLCGALAAVGRDLGRSSLSAERRDEIAAMEQTCRAVVGAEASESLVASGEAMTYDGVVAYCLAREESP